MEPNKQGFFNETQQLVEQYIQERLLLLKYQTAEKTAAIVSALLLGLCFGFLALLIVLLLTTLAVYFLARITDNWYWALLIMTGVYAFVLLVVFLKRTSLRSSFSDLIISLFFSDSHDLNDGKQGN